MTITSQIASDTRAARRFRLFVPVVVLLGLALLIMAPGMIAGLDHGGGASPQMVHELAPHAPEG